MSLAVVHTILLVTENTLRTCMLAAAGMAAWTHYTHSLLACSDEELCLFALQAV